MEFHISVGYSSTLGQNVYTIGFGHDHPAGDVPSPNDVWQLFYPPYNVSSLRNAGSAAIQFYENNAAVAATTPNGNFIVTITDWSSMQTYYYNNYSNSTQQNTFNTNFVTYGQDYLNNNPSASAGEASAYALMKTFPGMINIFESIGHDSNTYYPLTNSTTGNLPKISVVQCP